MSKEVRISLRDAGGVMVSALSAGIVTRAVLKRLIAQTADTLDGDAPCVYLADFRPCVWALGVDDLNSPLNGVNPAIVAPAALVVSPAHYDLFKQHAWDMAHRGIMRKVFTDPDAAAAWARARVPARRRS